jgi:hypothetical protein
MVMKNRSVCVLLCLLFLSFGSLCWAQDNLVQEKRLSPVADTSVSDRSFLIRLELSSGNLEFLDMIPSEDF